MAISFIVEDGTGLTNSTSYVSVAEFYQYWENKGVDYTDTDTYPTATIQAWLNDATAYADLTKHWAGAISDEDQALAVPRTGWSDCYGRDVDDSVPTYLKNGVCELAGSRQGTDPESTAEYGVASHRYGPVSVTYRGGANGQSVTYPTADRWFAKLHQKIGMRNWPA